MRVPRSYQDRVFARIARTRNHGDAGTTTILQRHPVARLIPFNRLPQVRTFYRLSLPLISLRRFDSPVERKRVDTYRCRRTAMVGSRFLALRIAISPDVRMARASLLSLVRSFLYRVETWKDVAYRTLDRT